MSGWDGSGNFILPFSWVAEAAAGVKILAAHQDTQWAVLQVGIENCMTLDGQTTPTADINLNSHKLINVADPVNPQDAATKHYVSTTGSEWVQETAGPLWINGEEFSLTGVDRTAVYHAGRRVRITHNSGGTVSTGTVVSSLFSANTTVIVAMDSAVQLDSTITLVEYGIISYSPPSYLDPRSIVSVRLSAAQAYTAAAFTKILFNTVTVDKLQEFDFVTTHNFFPYFPGIYLATLNVQFQQTGSTPGFIACGFNINSAGVSVSAQTDPQGGTSSIYSLSFTKILSIGSLVSLGAYFSAGVNGSILSGLTGGTTLELVRIA